MTYLSHMSTPTYTCKSCTRIRVRWCVICVRRLMYVNYMCAINHMWETSYVCYHYRWEISCILICVRWRMIRVRRLMYVNRMCNINHMCETSYVCYHICETPHVYSYASDDPLVAWHDSCMLLRDPNIWSALSSVSGGSCVWEAYMSRLTCIKLIFVRRLDL